MSSTACEYTNNGLHVCPHICDGASGLVSHHCHKPFPVTGHPQTRLACQGPARCGEAVFDKTFVSKFEARLCVKSDVTASSRASAWTLRPFTVALEGQGYVRKGPCFGGLPEPSLFKLQSQAPTRGRAQSRRHPNVFNAKPRERLKHKHAARHKHAAQNHGPSPTNEVPVMLTRPSINSPKQHRLSTSA